MNPTKHIIEVVPAPTNPDIPVLTFGERVNVEALSELNAIIADLVAQKKFQVIADLTQTNHIDGSVLGVLMGFRGQAVAAKGNLILAGVTPAVEKALHVMGVHKLFDIYPAVYNAVQQFEEAARVETITLAFPSSLDFVPCVRDFISNIASMRGFEGKEAYRIQTIVDEICNNAIEHGSKESDSVINVRCTIDNDKMDLVVEDKGASKDSAEGLRRAVAKVQFTEQGKVSVEKRGRGLPIVAMLADMLEIDTRSGPGTKIHIVKFKKQENEYFTL
ncbi:MAG: STAS domain-containing protein [Gemmatimonadetes bacterium]|nr:MAG: STAS domain-containing protein [Gemmatimonadota bacterium]